MDLIWDTIVRDLKIKRTNKSIDDLGWNMELSDDPYHSDLDES